MTDTRAIRVALYARVSTSNHGQDVTLQTRELKEFIDHRGWQFAGEYVDLGISGSRNRRPELDRLMADAQQRQFDVVIVWKFDRFARSVSHLLRALQTFQALGINFVSLSESLDTSTPAGKMVFTVLGAVAELERSLIVERVKAGLRNARAKGKRLGRPRVILDVYRIAELRNAGLSWPQSMRGFAPPKLASAGSITIASEMSASGWTNKSALNTPSPASANSSNNLTKASP